MAGLVWGLLASPALAQVTYYVDQAHPAASDANPGTETLPFKTIQKAADVVRAGDTVIVRPGTYPERVSMDGWFQATGTRTAPITFRAEPRRTVTMQGFDLGCCDAPRGVDYIRIEGFVITGTTSNGISGRYSTGIEVVDNRFVDIRNAAAGILSQGDPSDYVRVIGNEVVGCVKGFEVAGNGVLVENNVVTALKEWGTGLDVDYMRFFGSNGVIRNNRFYGIDLSPANIGSAHVDCMQTWGTTTDWVIEGNLCADAHQGVFARTTSGVITRIAVRNNIFMRIGAWGTMISNEFVDSGQPWDMQFFNNVVAYMGIHGFGCRGYARCEVRNNIFYNAGSNYVTAEGGVITASHNLLFKAGTTLGGPNDSGNILNQDPLFVDPGGATNLGPLGDLHLRSGSPAIDAGLGLAGFAEDRDGTRRPQGSAWDIGPYEYRLGPAPPSGLRVTPVL